MEAEVLRPHAILLFHTAGDLIQQLTIDAFIPLFGSIFIAALCDWTCPGSRQMPLYDFMMYDDDNIPFYDGWTMKNWI